jgi:hypothetical protein
MDEETILRTQNKKQKWLSILLVLWKDWSYFTPMQQKKISFQQKKKQNKENITSKTNINQNLVSEDWTKIVGFL